MVRVWSCHHFQSQDVVTTTHEPLATYSSDDKLFVATSQCYIEVYDLFSKGCQQIYKFPTVDIVKKVVFSETDDYIATLEGTSDCDGAVRVYLNWREDLSKNAMRARVAGDLTSMRQCKKEGDDQRMEVVAIPLKKAASCIGIDGATGNLAIGVGNGVLVYAMCCKIVDPMGDDCKFGYEDIKCLLELSFDFKVKDVALCEEYIAVNSDLHLQVVRLNLKHIPPPTKEGERKQSTEKCPFMNGAEDNETKKGDSEENEVKTEYKKTEGASDTDKSTTATNTRDSGLESSSSHSEDSDAVPLKRPARRAFSRQTSNSQTTSLDNDHLTSSSSMEDPVASNLAVTDHDHSPRSSLRSVAAIVQEEPDQIVEDKFHITLDVSGADDGSADGVGEHRHRTLGGLGATSMEQKTVLLNNIKTAREKQAAKKSKSINFGTEILGPKIKHPACPVRVEFESVCCSCPNKQSADLVRRGVITCLYKKMSALGVTFHSLQLKPFYSKGGPCTRNNYSWEEFISVRRGDLVGVFCFASTSREGFLYDVMDKVSLLTTYPYAAECIQVMMGSHLLYAATANSIEIYTTRCLPSILHRNLRPTEVLPDKNLEICLVGLQPFIGLSSVNMSLSRVVLLSKMAADKASSEENSWSLYALHKASLLELYEDMMELGEQHRAASLPTYLHLLQECHLLARSHLYLIGDHGCHDYKHHNEAICYVEKIEKLEQIVAESALKLGHHYAGMVDESAKLASLYYLMSGVTLPDLISHWKSQGQTKKEVRQLEGLLQHLDRVLFQEDVSLAEISEPDASWILQLFGLKRPHRLSSLILKSQLKNCKTEQALEVLQRWMNDGSNERQQSKTKHLDLLAMSVLHLNLGDLTEAEAVLFSMTKGDLVTVCVDNHQVLHEGLTTCTPLSQLLRRHEPDVFVQILACLHDNGVFTMDTSITLLQGAAPKESDPECSSEGHSTSHLTQYLELLLSDKSRHSIFKLAAAKLVPMYLAKLQKRSNYSSGKVLTLKEILPKVQGHFGKRYSWLDHMPPFQGPKSLRQPCLYLASQTDANPASRLKIPSQPLSIMRAPSPKQLEAECDCAMCCAELLKLQSLLISKHMDSDLLHNVLEVTEGPQPIRGQDSLRALCLAKVDPKAACDLILTQYPAILGAFLTETFQHNAEVWSHVTSSLFDAVKQWEGVTEENTDKYSTYKSALKDVLSTLAERMPPSEFINLLPYEGSTSFLLEFVEKSLKSQQSKELLVMMQQRTQSAENQT